jgi:caffeoyl-CoA O-methyltransferase
MSLPGGYPPELGDYAAGLFAREDAVLSAVADRAAAAGLPAIALEPLEGRFLQVVVAAVGAKRALEIGTLAGYSGLWIARGLPADGRLVTLEADEAHAQVARETFREAHLADRVEIRVGDARETLPVLAGEAPFDFVFIDADKPAYPEYLDWALRLTRPGAAILAHNVFLGGDIASAPDDERVGAMRAFNRRLAEDPRLASTLLPLRDGMALAIVREAGGGGGR